MNWCGPLEALTCSIAARYRQGSSKASALCRYFADLTSERQMAEWPEQSHPRSIDARPVRSPRLPMRSYRGMPCRSRSRVEIVALLQRQCACFPTRERVPVRFRSAALPPARRCPLVQSHRSFLASPMRFRATRSHAESAARPSLLPQAGYARLQLDGQPTRLIWQGRLGSLGISRYARGLALHSRLLPRSGGHAALCPRQTVAWRPNLTVCRLALNTALSSQPPSR